MTLNNLEKSNYIKNNFHQYFNLTLNTNLKTTETVNLVIPINSLTEGNIVHDNSSNFEHNIEFPEGYNIADILDAYEDTEYEKEIQCTCKRVIDGDTLVVCRPHQEKEEKIRLVGINTPELNMLGGDVSKDFLKKICAPGKNKEIYLKIDSKKEMDKYGRKLAVLIVDNKNINEVMLKEGLAQITYIPPSEFNPFDWGDANTPISVYNFQNDDINVLSPYLILK